MTELTPIQPTPSRPLSEIRACTMSLYPTKDSLIEAVQYIESQIKMPASELFPLLMCYHNTLIKVLAEETNA